MNKVISSKNTNNKKAIALFLAQVFTGVMPVLLLVFFVSFKLYEKKETAIVCILLIFLCNIL